MTNYSGFFFLFYSFAHIELYDCLGDRMGQNLAWYGSDAYIVNDNVTAHVWRWAHEVVYYNFEANDCSAMCGHYTQIVWKDSTRVSLFALHLFSPIIFLD